MPLPDIDNGVYDTLIADSTVSGIVGTKIYAMEALAGAVLPYVVFYEASGVIPNEAQHEQTNMVYRCDCWADSRAGAFTLKSAVYDALHNITLGGLTGWTNYSTKITASQQFLELFEGVQYHRYVLDVRIRNSAN